MKKEFIFPAKARELISELPENEKGAAYSHIVGYALCLEEADGRYAELEKLIDLTNNPRGKASAEDCEYIIGLLNAEAGTKYQTCAAKTRSCINARFAEGFGREDFAAVIRHMVREWKGNDKMAGYIRPETLFSNKFEGYLNRARTLKNSGGSFDTDEFYEAAVARAYGDTGG